MTRQEYKACCIRCRTEIRGLTLHFTSLSCLNPYSTPERRQNERIVKESLLYKFIYYPRQIWNVIL